MFKKIILNFGIIVFIFLPLFSVDATTGIENLKTNLGSAGEKAGLGKAKDVTDATTKLPQRVGLLIKWVLGIIGTLGVVYAIYGGTVWITAGGSAEKVKTAQKIILNAVLGIIAVSMAYLIVALAISFAG